MQGVFHGQYFIQESQESGDIPSYPTGGNQVPQHQLDFFRAIDHLLEHLRCGDGVLGEIARVKHDDSATTGVKLRVTRSWQRPRYHDDGDHHPPYPSTVLHTDSPLW